jgi:hypothetical protein
MNKGDKAVRIKTIKNFFRFKGWWKEGWRVFGNKSHEKKTYVWSKSEMRVTQVWVSNAALDSVMKLDHYHPSLSIEEVKKQMGSYYQEGFFPLESCQLSQSTMLKNIYNSIATHLNAAEELFELLNVSFPAEQWKKIATDEIKEIQQT